MDRYQKLAALRCFTTEDLLRLTGSQCATEWQLKSYLQKGYIERIRRGLYAVISLETGRPIPDRYQIASRVADDAYVSHHSAFEYYGYANQVFYEVYFASAKRVRPFSYDGVNYRPLLYRGDVGITTTPTGVRVTSLERTVIDSIADLEKIAGLEELLRCLLLIPFLSPDKLLEALALHGKAQLYQKAGFILEAVNDSLSLPESFFAECASRSSLCQTA